MMDHLKRLVGMAWATPAVRTFAQTAGGLLLAAFAADHLSVFDGDVIRGILAAALAAAGVKLQAAARA